MGNKTLCFVIEEKELYMEQCLVEYMGVPIFFLCKSDGQYYVVLYADMEEGKYFVVESSLTDVYNLLHGKLVMRNIFMKQEFYWEVLSEDEISEDSVMKKSISEIAISELPVEDALYQALTSDVKEYMKKFDSDFLNQAYYSSMKIPRGDSCVCDFVLSGIDVSIIIESIDKSKQTWERLEAYKERLSNLSSNKMEDALYIVDGITDCISIAA